MKHKRQLTVDTVDLLNIHLIYVLQIIATPKLRLQAPSCATPNMWMDGCKPKIYPTQLVAGVWQNFTKQIITPHQLLHIKL